MFRTYHICTATPKPHSTTLLAAIRRRELELSRPGARIRRPVARPPFAATA